MKPIQVMFDEKLLAELDADPVVRDKGRSAVMRDAVAEYLDARRRKRIADEYESAYATGDALEEDLDGWEDEGEWPKD